MQNTYTSKLFFAKYPYRLMLSRNTEIGDPGYHSGWTIHNCRAWLLDKNISHRIYGQVDYNGLKHDPSTKVTVKASIFLEKKEDFDACVEKWKIHAISSTVPYDQKHVDALKANSRILVREKLIYRKYRYVVVFRRRWGEDVSDIAGWANGNLASSDGSGEWKMATSGWNPRLYLINEDDFVLTKLTWGDRIKEVMLVRIHSEL